MTAAKKDKNPPHSRSGFFTEKINITVIFDKRLTTLKNMVK